MPLIENYPFWFPVRRFDDRVGLWKNFRYLEDFLRRLTDTSGAPPTIFVAASDATADSINMAKPEYRCDGTADQVQINAAILALPDVGGRIVLSEGTFNTSAAITIPTAASGNDSFKFQGLGMYSTVIKAASSMTAVFAGGNTRRVDLENFKVDADAKATYCFDRVHGAHSFSYRVWAYNATSHGIRLGNNGADNISVLECWVTSNGGSGIEGYFDGFMRIISCYIADNTGDGINSTLNVGDAGLIAHNLFLNNGGYAVDHNNGQGNIVHIGNVLSGNGNTFRGGISTHNYINNTWTAGDHTGLVAAGADTDAIHDNVSAEISAITEKTAPVNADLVIIEDSAASNAKKKVQMVNMIPNAIHDDIASEINAITEKVTPVSADLVVIEDSAASNVKKRVQVGNLPSSGGTTLTTKGDLHGYDTGNTRIPVGTNDQVLTADSAQTLGLKWATGSGSFTFSGCQVTRTGDVNISAATMTAIIFNAENYDTDTYHDNSTNPTRFTAPSADKYLITGNISLSALDGNEYICRLDLNGVATNANIVYRGNTSQDLGTYTHSFARVLDLAANDYIEVMVFQASTAFTVTGLRTLVEMSRLG